MTEKSITCEIVEPIAVLSENEKGYTSFSEKHKKKMREKQFPKDLENAFKLGARLASAETADLK